jgi:hypothetical protein
MICALVRLCEIVIRMFRPRPIHSVPSIYSKGRGLVRQSPPGTLVFEVPIIRVSSTETTALSGQITKGSGGNPATRLKRGHPKRLEAGYLALDGVKWRVNEYPGSFK